MKQIPINFGNQLPDSKKYPTNISSQSKLERLLQSDFTNSDSYIIVTGFSSLEYLIKFFGKVKFSDKKQVKLVIGNELLIRDTNQGIRKGQKAELSSEVKEFWLEQGISPLYSSDIINLIELLKSNKIEARILDNLHAKIYCGDEYASMGSSNFSTSGLNKQLEANLRVSKKKEPTVYDSYKQIANYYFTQARDYNSKLIKLLSQLLQYVSWKEALSRAIAEILEGDWLKEYSKFYRVLSVIDPPIWPTQQEAIGQALYILDNHGSLLIADPTGAGKTRTSALLHMCVKNRMYLKSQELLSNSNTLLISPPQVVDNWLSEYTSLGSDFQNILSHGALSSGKRDKKGVGKKILNAKILIIDEAHNFLSRTSNRSLKIEHNTADILVLNTATPINRGVQDLFRLIEILDVNNLSDDALTNIENLRKIARKGRNLSPQDKKQLKSYIQEFIVRRTKKELNEKISLNPNAYKNALGNCCRYPKQTCGIYSLNESLSDIEIAKQISALSEKLKGLIRLRKITLKKDELKDSETQCKKFKNRLNAARALCRYSVRSALRSSQIALVEHLKGTGKAKTLSTKLGFPIPSSFKKDNETGDMISKLKGHKASLPSHNMTIDLPNWFTNLKEYTTACEEEILIYEQMYSLSLKLSGNRIKAKAALINKLFQKHDLLLAFDRRIISLYYIDQILKKEYPDISPLVVIGGNKTNKEKAKILFGLGSTAQKQVGLCSDAMAEGVNLQQASALILLDMPSVIRIAEQRIGRVDRMNSPHDEINIYFPDDHPEFALKSDLRFFRTAQDVDSILGGNIEIPDELVDKWENTKEQVITGQLALKVYKEETEKSESSFRDGIQDAFQSVRELVYGKNILIEEIIYNSIKESKATLISKVEVSKVYSNKNFAFFCVKGANYNAPHWLYMDEDTIKGPNKIVRNLPQICANLKDNLLNAKDLEVNDLVAEEKDIKEQFIKVLLKNEINNLPNKKRRAVELFKDLIKTYLKNAQVDNKRSHFLNGLKEYLTPGSTNEETLDYADFSKNLLHILQPRFLEFKKNSNSYKLLHLKSPAFKKELRNNPISTDLLKNLYDSCQFIRRLDRRIASCIIGIRAKKEE